MRKGEIKVGGFYMGPNRQKVEVLGEPTKGPYGGSYRVTVRYVDSNRDGRVATRDLKCEWTDEIEAAQQERERKQRERDEREEQVLAKLVGAGLVTTDLFVRVVPSREKGTNNVEQKLVIRVGGASAERAVELIEVGAEHREAMRQASRGRRPDGSPFEDYAP